MSLAKRFFFILILFLIYGSEPVFSQLWRYGNYSKEKEDTYEKELSKDAISVVYKKASAWSVTSSYPVRTFQIEALGGEIGKITLYEKSFSRKFNIDYKKEKFNIPDFWGLSEIHVLGKNLLQITYSVRGGSNEGYQNILILALVKGKFQVVMHVQSLNEYGYPEVNGLYTLDLKILGQNKTNYKAVLSTRKEYSNMDWSKNRLDYNKFFLVFNKGENIFYNQIRSLKGKFKFYDDNLEKSIQQEINGEFPIIHLDESDYYYINKIWYKSGIGEDKKISFYPIIY
jgi:hypothetical protein